MNKQNSTRPKLRKTSFSQTVNNLTQFRLNKLSSSIIFQESHIQLPTLDTIDCYFTSISVFKVKDKLKHFIPPVDVRTTGTRLMAVSAKDGKF